MQCAVTDVASVVAVIVPLANALHAKGLLKSGVTPGDN